MCDNVVCSHIAAYVDAKQLGNYSCPFGILHVLHHKCGSVYGDHSRKLREERESVLSAVRVTYA